MTRPAINSDNSKLLICFDADYTLFRGHLHAQLDKMNIDRLSNAVIDAAVAQIMQSHFPNHTFPDPWAGFFKNRDKTLEIIRHAQALGHKVAVTSHSHYPEAIIYALEKMGLTEEERARIVVCGNFGLAQPNMGSSQATLMPADARDHYHEHSEASARLSMPPLSSQNFSPWYNRASVGAASTPSVSGRYNFSLRPSMEPSGLQAEVGWSSFFSGSPAAIPEEAQTTIPASQSPNFGNREQRVRRPVPRLSSSLQAVEREVFVPYLSTSSSFSIPSRRRGKGKDYQIDEVCKAMNQDDFKQIVLIDDDAEVLRATTLAGKKIKVPDGIEEANGVYLDELLDFINIGFPLHLVEFTEVLSRPAIANEWERELRDKVNAAPKSIVTEALVAKAFEKTTPVHTPRTPVQTRSERGY
jgi:hypothetical protein